jgi:hypothetical protein
MNMLLLCMNVLGYLEEVLLLFKDLLCNSYILSLKELFVTLTYGVHCVYLVDYASSRIW